MKPSEFEISLSVKSYGKKKLLKIAEITTILPNYQRYRFQILIAQIDDLNEGCVKISLP